MKFNIIQWNGVALGIYRMDNGDKIPRHSHTWVHTICLVSGDAEAEIFGDRVIRLESNENHILPAHIDHEFRALADGTVLVALSDAFAATAPPGAKSGGIMFDDGTVLYD